ncbi:MAG: tetratricopeptide repeat protein [Bacteroidia bacterium]|nr:tetratricopeptide repeat protein [Bacteroidia bacterium]
MKKVFFLLLTGLLFLRVHAQLSDASAKKLNKAVEVFKSGNFDKAIADVEKVLAKEPEDQVWSLLAQLYMVRAQNRKTSLPPALSSEAFAGMLSEALWKIDNVKNDTGSRTINISLPTKESWEMKQFFIRALYQSEAEFLWIYYRMQYLDIKHTADIDPGALKVFEKAEAKFQIKDYNQAAVLYREALAIQPDYYKASLYLGDAYYLKQDYDSAIKYFDLCKKRFPYEMEPAKYLTDAYYKSARYEEALEACIDGLTLFPEKGMIAKLEMIAEKLDRNFNYQWVKRGVEPAKALSDDKTKVSGAWKVYLDAARQAYTNKLVEGALEGDMLLEGTRYPEVYAWKKMLESEYGQAAEFTRAREAMNAGYLEPYVLLIQYHMNFHTQWIHYKNSPDNRIHSFFTEFVLK